MREAGRFWLRCGPGLLAGTGPQVQLPLLAGLHGLQGAEAVVVPAAGAARSHQTGPARVCCT